VLAFKHDIAISHLHYITIPLIGLWIVLLYDIVFAFYVTFIIVFRRFDLIFLMLDPEDEIFDRKLANHLVSLYYKSTEHEQQELLVNYIVFEFFDLVDFKEILRCLLMFI